MSKKRKIFLKFLYYILISIVLLALAIVCIGIIFYASGYKINWKAKKINKTGMLLINSQEEKLRVLIDKKEVKVSQTRSTIILSSTYTLSMLPGEYDLEIQKDGRIPYDEHIKIEKELVTKINDVLLLPEKISDEIFLSGEMASYSFSPDNKKIVYQTPDNKVLSYNIDTIPKGASSGQQKLLDEKIFDEKIISYTWSNDGNRVILKINKKEGPFYYILNLENISNSFFLEDRMSFLPFFDDLYFLPFNLNELFGINKKDLYKINISASKVDKVAANISHFKQNKNFSYYLDKDNSLIRFDAKGLQTGIILEKFELSDDFDLITINNENNVYIKNNSILYLIEDRNNLKLIDKDVESIISENNDYQFIYTKGYEIWNYDSSKEASVMITRFGKKIENIQEFFNDKYLLYQQGQDIEVIKKDGKNNQVVHNSVENVRVLDKNKMVVVEPKDNQKNFKLIDLTIK